MSVSKPEPHIDKRTSKGVPRCAGSMYDHYNLVDYYILLIVFIRPTDMSQQWC